MALTLHSHPLASFCHKVLIALYEAGTEFEPVLVDFANPDAHARFLDLWPVGKMPVLRDSARNETIPESSIIIEYLDQHYPGQHLMLPPDPAQCLQARLWDRFFDLHVHDPMQRIVSNELRPDHSKDPTGVAEAKDRLMIACKMIERHMMAKTWAAGDSFSIADCAAAPALFYANCIVPFDPDQTALLAYFERLVARPSVKRVLSEAQPYFRYFPFHASVPHRFLAPTGN